MTDQAGQKAPTLRAAGAFLSRAAAIALALAPRTGFADGGYDGPNGPAGGRAGSNFVVDPGPAAGEGAARIKDLVEFEGVRGNDLVGYGLVVGLDGSGDGLRNSPFTEEALSSLLERLGVNVTGEQFRPRNVAAVLVTATLPAFARAGSRIDVTVSTIGDAKSLLGGTLIMTPLNGADGDIYAVAQGSVISGGARAGGEAAFVTQGVPTAGTVPGGARVEREVVFDFERMSQIRLAVRDADFTTAARIAAAVNGVFGRRIAHMLDSGTVELDVSAARGFTPAEVIASIENIEVAPSQKARVVVDHRSGTIVLGSDVRVSRIAVSQGNIILRVNEQPIVSQPNPFARNGETVVVPRTEADIQEDPGLGLALVNEAVTLADLVGGLNALGVGPRDMIDILKAIKLAGALHAEFVVQ
ncbi:flagellar basal body P-ring protein FlgI [Rubrimonas cliftonensis]|uniref:Flagellar P-ring protein n=1 Tax=Rubrimonas cliftonensis TaxID=89524 RepID=A0A1H3VX94_9RHOB|nr:flagellar basal body P-ring protein FlgI [Rubrimonas cliftonensis]SDZ78722.1 flagellar P-ring protein precursor FlgI [Rubrimonas cliftonensis]